MEDILRQALVILRATWKHRRLGMFVAWVVGAIAAGVIHSDLQRGFIRAEQMSYAELMEFGGEAELKKAGKTYLQGKEYIVADGDILNIRFKV